MIITLSNIGAILDMQNFVADKNKVTLTVEQLQAIETAIANNLQKITSLNNRITELSTSPADSSKAVIENAKPEQSEKSDVEQFFDTVNSARKLYDLV